MPVVAVEFVTLVAQVEMVVLEAVVLLVILLTILVMVMELAEHQEQVVEEVEVHLIVLDRVVELVVQELSLFVIKSQRQTLQEHLVVLLVSIMEKLSMCLIHLQTL